MAIRKTGSVTGKVTGVESPLESRFAALASKPPEGTPWGTEDDQALADENAAADQGDD